jgi:hypothetical protein
MQALDTVEGELGVTEGPWFLRDPGPSIVRLVLHCVCWRDDQ